MPGHKGSSELAFFKVLGCVGSCTSARPNTTVGSFASQLCFGGFALYELVELRNDDVHSAGRYRNSASETLR